MSLSPNLLFKPMVPHQPVATVILVENSQAMSYIWSDLQDQYLNKLVDKLKFANPFSQVCDDLRVIASATNLPLLSYAVFTIST